MSIKFLTSLLVRFVEAALPAVELAGAAFLAAEFPAPCAAFLAADEPVVFFAPPDDVSLSTTFFTMLSARSDSEERVGWGSGVEAHPTRKMDNTSNIAAVNRMFLFMVNLFNSILAPAMPSVQKFIKLGALRGKTE